MRLLLNEETILDFHRMYRSILAVRLANFAPSIIHKRNLFLEMYVKMNIFISLFLNRDPS